LFLEKKTLCLKSYLLLFELAAFGGVTGCLLPCLGGPTCDVGFAVVGVGGDLVVRTVFSLSRPSDSASTGDVGEATIVGLLPAAGCLGTHKQLNLSKLSLSTNIFIKNLDCR
jgi:hypothetical protein